MLVEITDDGSGIPREIKNRILETFFTIKGIDEEANLGLDHSLRLIITGHSGEIRVDPPGELQGAVANRWTAKRS